MNVSFRKARPDDLQILRNINFSSFQANAAYDPHIDMNWINTEHATTYFIGAITRPDHLTLIALVDGIDAGFIILEPKEITYRSVRIAEVGIIAVLPEFRSRGLGKALVSEAKKWAMHEGFDTLFVNSYIQNTGAIRFYTSAGFTPIDMSLELDLR